MLGIGLHDPASFSLPLLLTLHTQRELKKSMSVTLRQRGKSTHPGGLPVLLLQYPLQGSLLLGREPVLDSLMRRSSRSSNDHDKKKGRRRGGLETIELTQTENQTQSKREERAARGGTEEQAGKR